MDRHRHAQHDGVPGEPQVTIHMPWRSPVHREDTKCTKHTNGFWYMKSFVSLRVLRVFVMMMVTGLVAVAVRGQGGGLDPALLTKPPTDAWPTYHGDYSGRRYSTLNQINAQNVKNLALAWIYRLNTSSASAIVGGEGPETP